MDSFLLILLVLILYVSVLFLVKLFSIGEKETCDSCRNCCPDCKHAMERIKRMQGDYFLNHLTFHMFNLKRYRCMDCGWEGLKWEKQYKPGKN